MEKIFTKFKELFLKNSYSEGEKMDPLNRKFIKYAKRLVIICLFFIFIFTIAGTLSMFVFVSFKEPFSSSLLISIALIIGLTFFALWILGLIYVEMDSKRRGMPSLLWVLICLLVPYFLGFLLYFLVRRPLPLTCPNCGKIIPNGSKFCPECGFNITKTCPKCGVSIPEGANFCPQCGSSTKAEL